MLSQDTKNIFNSYFSEVLLENTINQLSPQDKAKLSRLEHLRDIIQSKTDMSGEEKENALNKVNSAIDNIGANVNSDPNVNIQSNPSAKKPYFAPDGTMSVGPKTITAVKPTEGHGIVSTVDPYKTMSEDGSYFTYTVQKGDNFGFIKAKTGVFEKDPSGMYFMEFNNIKRPRDIRVGDVLKIPVVISDLTK